MASEVLEVLHLVNFSSWLLEKQPLLNCITLVKERVCFFWGVYSGYSKIRIP